MIIYKIIFNNILKEIIIKINRHYFLYHKIDLYKPLLKKR